MLYAKVGSNGCLWRHTSIYGVGASCGLVLKWILGGMGEKRAVRLLVEKRCANGRDCYCKRLTLLLANYVMKFLNM